MNIVKNYFHGLVEEGFVGYFKERKALYGFIALMLFLKSDFISYGFRKHGASGQGSRTYYCYRFSVSFSA